MNPREYERMAAVEADHWWYRGLRQQLGQSLKRFGQRLPSRPNILDAGCGTGENLRYLNTLYVPQYVGGFDTSPQAVAWSRQKVAGADIYSSDVCAPDLHADHYDIVLSCDVLYVPGLTAALAGMQAIAERMSPNGLLLINVPAYQWLRSDHDLAIGTTQRFVARDISQFLRELGLVPRLVTYRLCLLFPLVVASRLPSIIRPGGDRSQAVSALKHHSPWSNRLLEAMMSLENRCIGAGVALPWGSSVYAVGQKVAVSDHVANQLAFAV